MNIPEIYLVEPYNAYAPKKKQKHWHEVIEEQALMAKIAAEQQAIMEASSHTLPPNSPDISTATPVAIPPAGGGGTLPPQVFSDSSAISVQINRSPSVGAAPLAVAFQNLVENPHLYTYLWTFSNAAGIISTSTDLQPTVTFQSQSDATDVITASLQVTSSVFGTPIGISVPVYTSASIPVLTSAFTLVSSNSASLTAGYYTASVGDVITFINGASMTNGLSANELTSKWNFNSGSDPIPTSSLVNPSYTFTAAGDYLVILGVTGSYNIMAAGSRRIQIVE